MYIYIYIYTHTHTHTHTHTQLCSGGFMGWFVIIGNGNGDLSSNPGWDCLHFVSC